MKSENNIITDWLNKNGNPEIEKFVEVNLTLCEKIMTALLEKGWTNADLAKKLDIPLDKVNVWLTGLHNWTLKELIKIEIVLDINLIK